MGATGVRAAFILVRRLLAGAQAPLLLGILGPDGVALFASVLALQQLLYGASASGYGYWIYTLDVVPLRLRRLVRLNIFSGLPRLAVAVLGVSILPLLDEALRNWRVVLLLAAIAIGMKIDEIAHSLTDRFIGVVRAEAVGLLGILTSSLVLIATLTRSWEPLNGILLAVSSQALVQAMTAIILVVMYRARIPILADHERFIMDRPLRRSLIVDQLSSNLLTQIELLLLVRLAPAEAFGIAYAVTRPGQFVAGALANLVLRRGPSLQATAGATRRRIRAPATFGAIIAGAGAAYAYSGAPTLVLSATMLATTLLRPWYLVAASRPLDPIARREQTFRAQGRAFMLGAGIGLSMVVQDVRWMIGIAAAIAVLDLSDIASARRANRK